MAMLFAVGLAAPRAAAEQPQPGQTPVVLGVHVVPPEDGQGARVMAVMPGSPAEKAGIQVGDVIVSVGDKKIASADQLREVIGGEKPGAKVEIRYRRGGQDQKAQAMLTAARRLEGGRPGPGPGSRIWLGVLIEQEDGRVVVERVHPAGPAAKAGIQPGDVILRVGGQRIENALQVRDVLEEKKPDEKVEITLRRGDEEKTLNATLGAPEWFPRRDFIPGPMRMGRESRGESSEEEWHQRIEKQLEKLAEEVRSLRKEFRQHEHKQKK